MRKPAHERLFSFLVEATGPLDSACWVFTGHCYDEYGRFWYEGKEQQAHRAAFDLWVAEIPAGIDVLHRCDNPPCCNPEHLFLGNDKVNSDDKYNKNRQVHLLGSANGRTIITEEQAYKIKGLLKENFRPMQIAKRLNISYDIINGIRRGQTWRHVDGPNGQ